MTTVQLPQPTSQWMDPERLNTAAELLLDIGQTALQAFGIEEKRNYITHGPDPLIEPGARQLLVVCTGVGLGQPGRAEFQEHGGALGRYSFQTFTYSVEVWHPWPQLQQGGRLPQFEAMNSARSELWRDAYIVFSALLAAALGGVRDPRLTGQQVHPGPLAPKGPLGDLAGWACAVEVRP